MTDRRPVSRVRNARAFLHYVRRPLRGLLPQATLLTLLLVAGAFSFQHLYDVPPGESALGFWRALYLMWALVFMEHVLPFPGHWLLRVYYFVIPLVGFVVVLDGILRVSYTLLRRDQNSREWTTAMVKTYSDHVILVGLGKVGLRILEELLALGELVVVLEKEVTCPNLAFARSRGVPVLTGSVRTPAILADLGIERAKSVVCASDDDLANLEIAIDSRKLRPDIRIVLRMFDKELAVRIRESMNIHAAFSTTQTAAPLFATAASDRSIVSAFYVGQRLLVVARFEVLPGTPLSSMSIGQLGESHPVHVLEHERGTTECYHPEVSLALLAGDVVTLQSDPDVLREIHALNVPDPGAPGGGRKDARDMRRTFASPH
jgi:Trk K+ transport system NAD-binding subunit